MTNIIQCAIRLRQLHIGGGNSYAYHVVVEAELSVAGEPIRHIFHLDTKTDVSLLSRKFYDDRLATLGVRLDSQIISLDTPAGNRTTTGRIARGIEIHFGPAPEHRHVVDFLVADDFDREYGLLSFRDLHNHFYIRTTGTCSPPPPGHIIPAALGQFALIPRPRL